MSVINRLQSIEVTPRTAAFCVGFLVLVCAVVVIAFKSAAEHVPEQTSVRRPVKPAGSVVDVKEVAKDKTAVKADKTNVKAGKDKPANKEAAKAEEPAKDPYAVIAERNLFSAPGSKESAPAKPADAAGGPANTGSVPPMPVPGIGQLPKLPGIGIKPIGGDVGEIKKTIAFTGAVETPSGALALIENISSKESRFVAKGESAFGCTVCDITPQMVLLEKDGVRFNLAIGENKPDVDSGGGPKPGEQKPPEGGKPPEPGRPPQPGKN